MMQNIDKNRLKDVIQKAKVNDLMYVVVSAADTKSLDAALQKIDLFVGRNTADIIVVKRK
jgi:hypothetical protein